MKTWERGERTCIIQSATDAEELVRSGRPLLAVRAVVRIPSAPRERSLQWEQDLNTSFHECGCSLAAVCMAVVFGGSCTWRVFHLSSNALNWRPFFLHTFVELVLAAVMGKVAGLLLAKLRIARIIGQMRRLQLDGVIGCHNGLSAHEADRAPKIQIQG